MAVVLTLIPLMTFAQEGSRWQLLVLGGVFSPADDEIQNVYGTPMTGKVALTMPLGELGRMRIAGTYLERRGDPFYQTPDFFAGDASELTLKGVSFTIESRARTAKNPRIYFGVGVDYVFARERITGLNGSKGEAIGAHLVLTPEVELTKTVALIGEVGYQFLQITFKSGRNRYRFNLSGARLLAGLAFKIGS